MNSRRIQVRGCWIRKLSLPGRFHRPISKKSWLPNNREAAARFIKATVEAIALIKTDKQAAFSSMKNWYGISDRAHQESIYAEAAKLASKPYPHVEGIKAVMATYAYHEMTRHKPEDFYDASFIAELDKSGYIDSLYKK